MIAIQIVTTVLLLAALVNVLVVGVAAVWVLRHRKVIVPTATQLLRALATLSMQTRP